MNPRFLVDAGLRFGVRAPLPDTPCTTLAVRRGATCAMATAVAAEAQDQRVTQRIKVPQTERFR